MSDVAVSVSAEILVHVPESEDDLAAYAEKVVADALRTDERIFLAHANREVLLAER